MLYPIPQEGEPMSELTKSQRKHIRSLAQRAYEKELSQALNSLHERFQKWHANEISPWDLSEDIHKYHDGTARDLYKFYEMTRNFEFSVAHAVANGVLDFEEIEENCRPLLQLKIDHLRSVR
jgi:hypothetical protein